MVSCCRVSFELGRRGIVFSLYLITSILNESKLLIMGDEGEMQAATRMVVDIRYAFEEKKMFIDELLDPTTYTDERLLESNISKLK